MKFTVFLNTLALSVAVVWLIGCASTAPKLAEPVKHDLQFTDEINATVTADQAIVMAGKKFKVADVPAELARQKASKHITIIVYPESKMTRYTMIELIKKLVENKYSVAVDPSSKYADVPVPRS